jgi:hypothetical protein
MYISIIYACIIYIQVFLPPFDLLLAYVYTCVCVCVYIYIYVYIYYSYYLYVFYMLIKCIKVFVQRPAPRARIYIDILYHIYCISYTHHTYMYYITFYKSFFNDLHLVYVYIIYYVLLTHTHTHTHTYTRAFIHTYAWTN